MSAIPDDARILSLGDDDLAALQFFGPDALPGVIDLIASARNLPEHFGWLTVFHVACFDVKLKYQPSTLPYPSPSTSTGNAVLSEPDVSDSTVGDDDYISPFERAYFYNGISTDPPPLFQRSDLKQRSFFNPEDRHAERHFAIPVKTAHTANHAILNNRLWKESVAPEIIALCKEETRGIRVSTMLPVRFSTLDEDGKDVFDDHITLWISVHPNITKRTSCRDANAPILGIFAKYNIHDVSVHWIEGAVEPLAGPPEMMPVARDTNPTHWIRRALTTVLGVPLAAQDIANIEAQGSLGLYFRRGKDRHGQKSEEVMAITNKHVVSKRTNKDYEDTGRRGTRKQYIRNCSSKRFEQLLDETRALLAEKLGDATLFAEQLTELLAERTEEEDEEFAKDIMDKEYDLKKAGSDAGILADFMRVLKSNWSDPFDRMIAWVDWAPKIATDLDPRRYTRDIATLTVEKTKFSKNFKGNVVYLAGKFTRAEIIGSFYPNAANPPAFKCPKNDLFRLSGYVDAEDLSTPYFVDDDNNPCFVVAKAGQTTDLTFGRQSELEAYTCRDRVGESWEIAILNFGGTKHGDFSAKGDSGAAIFNAEGKMVALLHSGMPRGTSNHVTFGTPGHYVYEVIREHYPDADFSCF